MGLSSQVAAYGTLGVMVLNAVAAALAMFTTKKFGMRRTWLVTNAIMLVALTQFFVIGFFIETSTTLLYTSMISLIIYVFFSNLGVLPITFMFAVEYQRPEHRGFTQSVEKLNISPSSFHTVIIV